MIFKLRPAERQRLPEPALRALREGARFLKEMERRKRIEWLRASFRMLRNAYPPIDPRDAARYRHVEKFVQRLAPFAIRFEEPVPLDSVLIADERVRILIQSPILLREVLVYSDQRINMRFTYILWKKLPERSLTSYLGHPWRFPRLTLHGLTSLLAMLASSTVLERIEEGKARLSSGSSSEALRGFLAESLLMVIDHLETGLAVPGRGEAPWPDVVLLSGPTSWSVLLDNIGGNVYRVWLMREKQLRPPILLRITKPPPGFEPGDIINEGIVALEQYKRAALPTEHFSLPKIVAKKMERLGAAAAALEDVSVLVAGDGG